MSCVFRLGPFLRGYYIQVELIHGLVLFRNNCLLLPGPFFEEVNTKVELIHGLVLFRNNCVLWLGPFLNELCVSAWSFFDGILYSNRVNT